MFFIQLREVDTFRCSFLSIRKFLLRNGSFQSRLLRNTGIVKCHRKQGVIAAGETIGFIIEPVPSVHITVDVFYTDIRLFGGNQCLTGIVKKISLQRNTIFLEDCILLGRRRFSICIFFKCCEEKFISCLVLEKLAFRTCQQVDDENCHFSLTILVRACCEIFGQTISAERILVNSTHSISHTCILSAKQRQQFCVCRCLISKHQEIHDCSNLYGFNTLLRLDIYNVKEKTFLDDFLGTFTIAQTAFIFVKESFLRGWISAHVSSYKTAPALTERNTSFIFHKNSPYYKSRSV